MSTSLVDDDVFEPETNPAEEDVNEDQTLIPEIQTPDLGDSAMDLDSADVPHSKDAPVKKRREKKETTVLEREPGKSLLPFSRVHKIIKADKEIPIVAKDATFLVALATEEFIRRISAAGQRAANRENRATVQPRDIAAVVRKIDEFLFLEEIIPWITADPPPKKTSKVKDLAQGTGLKSAPTMLDQFVTGKGANAPELAILPEPDPGSDSEEDVVMNEDGTMAIADS